jgi:hypothetical protein
MTPESIDRAQSIKWPSRKRPSIGHDIVDLGLGILNGMATIREAERGSRPARRLRKTQAELKGALVGIRTAGILAGAMCADTPEKKQAVLSEADDLCLAIRGGQPAENVIESPAEVSGDLQDYTLILPNTDEITLKCLAMFVEQRKANKSGRAKWKPIEEVGFAMYPSTMPTPTKRERLKGTVYKALGRKKKKESTLKKR